jgi:ElaB/YqjD/DUF883 family membrane-anchored ribosome-binding protein
MHTTQERLDEAARHAHDGLDTTQRLASRTIDRVADRAAEWRDEAAPVVDRITRRAEGLARDGAHWVQDGTDRVRSTVVRASDRTVGYVREEPVRSVLMAAAAGALIFALVRMLSGRSDR